MIMQISTHLIYWPKFLIHKCKQRFTKITQVTMEHLSHDQVATYMYATMLNIVTTVFDPNEKTTIEDSVSTFCVCAFVYDTVFSCRKKIVPLNRKVEKREKRREVSGI